MKWYILNVQVLTNIVGDEIGVDVYIAEHDEDMNIIDIIHEYQYYIDGCDDEDVEDRDFVVEEEFDSLLNAQEAFMLEKINAKNYLL